MIKRLFPTAVKIVTLFLVSSYSSFAFAYGDFAKNRPSEQDSIVGGGVVEGNGGEYITNEQNPWFLGEAPVNYCIKLDAAAFSANLNQARFAINSAFATWTDFIKSYGFETLRSPFLLAAKGNSTLSLDFREVSCDQEHELEFHLGFADSDIEKALHYTAKNVVALSYRNQYSDDTGRAKGQVWISADLGDQRYTGPNSGPGFWTKDFNLTNVLTHELGHVFGARHMKAGVMEENFPARMLEFGFESQITYKSIATPTVVCGKILSRDGLRSPEAEVSKIFEFDFAALKNVCLFYEFNGNADVYTLAFRLENAEVKIFSEELTLWKEPEFSLKGQFLTQTEGGVVHYEPFSFLTDRATASAQGILRSSSATYFVTLGEYQPSIFSFNVGYDGAWQEFLIVDDSQEVLEMLKLAQLKRD